jgi:hypothetical protein
MKNEKGNKPGNVLSLPAAAQQGEDGIGATNTNTALNTSIAGIAVLGRLTRPNTHTVNQFVRLVESISKRVHESEQEKTA